MTRDLHDYMSDALAQSTRALADTADDSNRVSRLRGAVRRRRTTRAAVRSTSVACVAVAVGALGWLVAPRHEPLPAQTPSPSVSATSTPTPTPTVDPVTVVLRHLDDLSVRDTAVLLGLSEGAVKRYVSDGVRALSARLDVVAAPVLLTVNEVHRDA